MSWLANRLRDEWLRQQLPDRVARAAARTVCAHANGVDDARTLLEACGLVGYVGHDAVDSHFPGAGRPTPRYGLLEVQW